MNVACRPSIEIMLYGIVLTDTARIDFATLAFWPFLHWKEMNLPKNVKLGSKYLQMDLGSYLTL